MRILAQARNGFERINVDAGNDDAHQRKQPIVLDHDRYKKDQRYDIDGIGGNFAGQKLRDPVVRSDPLADVASIALIEELDGQAQHMPEESAGSRQREPYLEPQQVSLLQPSECGAQQCGSGHSQEQRPDPVVHTRDQEFVHEHLREDRDHQARYHQGKARQYDEAQCPFGTLHARPQRFNQAAPFAPGFELRSRLEKQRNPGISLVELFVRNLARTTRRVIEIDHAGAKPLDHQKMIEIPEHDKRQLLRSQRCDIQAHSLGAEPITSCGLDDVAGLAAVTRYAANDAEFFKRHEPAKIRKDDRQGSRAALYRLHLQHRWCLDTMARPYELSPQSGYRVVQHAEPRNQPQ